MNIENLKNLLISIKEHKISCAIELSTVGRIAKVCYVNPSNNKKYFYNDFAAAACSFEIIDVKQDYLILKGIHIQNDKSKASINCLEIIPISEIIRIIMDDSFLENNFKVL